MNRMKDKNKRTKTWGFVAGAALLLAILTVVLCTMAGVFNFSPDKGDTAEVTAPPKENAVTAESSEPSASSEPTPSTTPDVIVWNISAISGKGGELTPSGLIEAEEGDSVTFAIIPDEGYVLSQLKIDGKNVKATGTYTFDNITENHSIYAVFDLVPAEETPVEETPAEETPEVTDNPTSPTDIG